MIWLYIAAAIFGGGFVLPMLLGSLDLDADADFDVDGGADFDLDADGDIDLDTGDGVIGGVTDWVSSLLSFRALVFFAAFFGAVGIVLTVMDYSEPMPFIAALGLGGFAGVINARLMAYLKRSEVSSHLTQREISGSTARVVLPIAPQRRGRVEISVSGQPTFMVALPFKREQSEMAPGSQVVVVEVREGTAYVAPLPSFEEGK